MKNKIIVIVFVALVASLALVARFLDREPAPEILVRDALAKFAAAENVQANVALDSFVAASSLSIDANNAPKVDAALVPVSAKGGLALRRRPDQPIAALSRLNVVVGSLLARAEVGVEFVVDGSGTTYVKVTGLPETTDTGLNLTSLNDRWLSLDRDTAAAVLLQKKIAAVPSGARVSASGSVAFDQLVALLVGGELFAVDRRMANDFVGGRSTRHFALRFQKEAVGRFVAALNAAIEGREFDPEEAEREAARVGEVYAVNGEIWVDKSSVEIRKFGVEIQSLTAAEASVPVRFVVEFTDFSAPIEIQPPRDAAAFVDVVRKQILGQ